jgi:hypothetical protein
MSLLSKDEKRGNTTPPGKMYSPGGESARIPSMKENSQKDLAVINGGRLEREQELVKLLFTGTQDEIDQKLNQLDPKGRISLISENQLPFEQ